MALTVDAIKIGVLERWHLAGPGAGAPSIYTEIIRTP
jgi:hypothetical protein